MKSVADGFVHSVCSVGSPPMLWRFCYYAYWPADISHKPFASLTLSDLLGTAAAVAIGFGLMRALFQPSDEDDIKDAWGWVGVGIVGLAAFAVFYFSPQR
ncbi:hypothetical protein [Bradyrhizobium liaoningense]|uniref:hypothetical protein n=1 Tax=Bradyrhizobium liaoningense TaxID=43992 RepID=UPI0012FE3F6F|nr:hypothetical protein [Bradyrhizobium liaoningense]